VGAQSTAAPLCSGSGRATCPACQPASMLHRHGKEQLSSGGAAPFRPQPRHTGMHHAYMHPIRAWYRGIHHASHPRMCRQRSPPCARSWDGWHAGSASGERRAREVQRARRPCDGAHTRGGRTVWLTGADTTCTRTAPLTHTHTGQEGPLHGSHCMGLPPLIKEHRSGR